MLYSKRRKNLGQRRKRSNRKSNGSKRLRMIGGVKHEFHFEVEKIMNFTTNQLPEHHFIRQNGFNIKSETAWPVIIKRVLYTNTKIAVSNSPYIDVIGLLYVSPEDMTTLTSLLLPIKGSYEATGFLIRNVVTNFNTRFLQHNNTYSTLSYVTPSSVSRTP
jgi:hypothetical protein